MTHTTQPKPKVARRIFSRRVSAGFTQEQLAEKIGTSRRHVIRWEKGTSAPRAQFRARLAEALGGDPGDYANGTEEDDEESDSVPSLDEFLRSRISLLVANERERVA